MGLSRRQLGDDEHVVLLVRPHARALVRPGVVLLALAPLVGAALAVAPDGPAGPWVLGGVGLVAAWVGFRFVLWPFLVWWHTVYALTTHRVAWRKGVISRRGRDVPLARVDDVTFTRETADRLTGSGRLVVTTSGGAPLVLEAVPKVEHVTATLLALLDHQEAQAIEAGDDVVEGDVVDEWGDDLDDDDPDDDDLDDDDLAGWDDEDGEPLELVDGR